MDLPLFAKLRRVGFGLTLLLLAGCAEVAANIPSNVLDMPLSHTQQVRSAADPVPVGTEAPLALPVSAVPAAMGMEATPAPPPVVPPDPIIRIESIGRSEEGRSIRVYKFGDGPRIVLGIGAIHGGYEWNTAAAVNALINHYQIRPSEIPPGTSLWLIPAANPDGMQRGHKLVGRFNSRRVDLNRNFDCQWEPTAVLGEYSVYPGEAPFSEAESRALRDFVEDARPAVVVFYHSQAGTTSTGSCAPPTAKTLEAARLVAEKTGYTYYPDNFYPVSGDATGYFNMMGLAAIEVELYTREDIDWSETLAGMQALLQWAAEQ